MLKGWDFGFGVFRKGGVGVFEGLEVICRLWDVWGVFQGLGVERVRGA